MTDEQIYLFLPKKAGKKADNGRPCLMLVKAFDTEMATLRAWNTWGHDVRFYSSLNTLAANVELSGGKLEISLGGV